MTGKRPHKIIFTKSPDGFRWSRVAGNGRIVGSSSECYERKRSAIENAKAMNKADYYRCEIVDNMPGRMASISRPPRIAD